jgi:hypothetical protein
MRRQLSASNVIRYELPTMSRMSFAPVEFHCIPAIVESPINETAGASAGGLAATASRPEPATDIDVTPTTATTAIRNTHRSRLGMFNVMGWLEWRDDG